MGASAATTAPTAITKTPTTANGERPVPRRAIESSTVMTGASTPSAPTTGGPISGSDHARTNVGTAPLPPAPKAMIASSCGEIAKP